MKASELMEQRPFLDIGIYGDSGSGKTRFGATSPRPLILLSEAHGLATIHDANPDADVELLTTAQQLFDTMAALKLGTESEVGGQPAWKWGGERVCQTVVLDTLTDIQRLVIRHVALGPAAADPNKHPEELSFRDWGRIGNIVEAILDSLRRLPVNVVVLCLAEHGEDDKSRRRTSPVLAGRVGKALAQYFAAFGYAAKREREGGVVYGIGWELASQYITKPAPGFPSHTMNTLRPGETSLGSLALATIGKRGLMVPHYDHDSAAHVERQEVGA
jgi:hypothetical protein